MLPTKGSSQLPVRSIRYPDSTGQMMAIRRLINLAARNGVLHQTFLGINRRLQALRFKSNFKPGKWERAVRDHIDMIEALEARDGDRLASILARHLLDKRAAVMEMQVAPAAAAASEGSAGS